MEPEKKFVPVKELKKDPVKSAIKDLKKAEIKKNGVPKDNVKKALKKFARNVMKTLRVAKEKKVMKVKHVNSVGRKGANAGGVGRKGFYPARMKTELYNMYQKNHSLKEDVLGKLRVKYPEAKNLNRNRAWSIISAMMKRNGVASKGRKVHVSRKVSRRGRPMSRMVRVVKHRDWEKMDETDSTEPTTKTVNVRVAGILFKVDHDTAKDILNDLISHKTLIRRKWK
jgi:hypothetical protein